MKGLFLLLLFATSLALAQPQTQDDKKRWFVSLDTDLTASKQTTTAILKAACQGDVHEGSCSQCPYYGEGSWTITALILGHLTSARSEEALVGASSCYYLGSSGVAILVGKRNGKWTMLESILAFQPENCMRRKLRSGREFLICSRQRDLLLAVDGNGRKRTG